MALRVAGIALVALTACSSGKATETAVRRRVTTTSQVVVPTMPPGAELPPAPTVPPVDSSTTTVVPSSGDAPLAPPFPWPSDLEVSGTLEPSCVRPGGAVSLRVATAPKAGVGYVATYAGNRGGAPPPYGDGLGGNEAGQADRHGRYEATWVVSAAAPAGPARVDVVVGREAKWGHAAIEFAVADAATGRCAGGAG